MLEAHLFICTNQRANGECCAKKGSVELRDKIKKMAKEEGRGWKGRVRINTAGCLDKCEEGIAAVLYPQGTWLTGLSNSEDSADEIIKALSKVLDKK